MSKSTDRRRIGGLMQRTLLPMLLSLTGCDAFREVQDATQGAPEPPKVVLSRNMDDDEPDAGSEEPVPAAPVPEPAPEPEPSAPDDVFWKTVSTSTEVSLPEPRPELIWQDDLPAALAEAQAEGRPVFVLMRCPESEQFRDLDQAIRQPSEALSAVLRQFVTVKITDLSNLNVRLLPQSGYQDPDVSLWCWFLSERGAVYSVFGGRDHRGDDTRVSAGGLRRVAERVLKYHHDSRRSEWNLEAAAPDVSGLPQSADTLPGYSSWVAKTRFDESAGCLRCHHMAEIARQPLVDAGTFRREGQLWVWPFPENLGFQLDREDGLEVTQVAPGSMAAQAGLRPGDRLAVAGDRLLFGQTDLRGVLHRLPEEDSSLVLRWLRGEELLSGAVIPRDERWRHTDLTWRRSIVFGQIGGVPGFLAAEAPRRVREAFRIPRGRMALIPTLPPDSPAYLGGLRPTDVIVQTNDHYNSLPGPRGGNPDISGIRYIAWFRSLFDPGETICLTVISTITRQRRHVYYQAPAFRPPATADNANADASKTRSRP